MDVCQNECGHNTLLCEISVIRVECSLLELTSFDNGCQQQFFTSTRGIHATCTSNCLPESQNRIMPTNVGASPQQAFSDVVLLQLEDLRKFVKQKVEVEDIPRDLDLGDDQDGDIEIEDKPDVGDDDSRSQSVKDRKSPQLNHVVLDGSKDAPADDDLVARERRDKVRGAMLHAWTSYETYAWGFDELRVFFTPDTKLGNTCRCFGLSYWSILNSRFNIQLIHFST